jgi:hypothetical protein
MLISSFDVPHRPAHHVRHTNTGGGLEKSLVARRGR